jgi:hypothetical protein
MKKLLEEPYVHILALCAIVVVFLLFLLVVPKPTYQVVNCSLAEISPDFTPELRKECRQLRATKL